MNPSPPRIRIPENAVAELETVEREGLVEGLSIDELVDWLNSVAARFRPGDLDEHSRAGAEFTVRTFRHYQTLGCVDPPERVNRRAIYGFRHYLQGLLIRRLIWERMPSEQIQALMKGRRNQDYKQMLFDGLEVIPAGGLQSEKWKDAAPSSDLWRRFSFVPGLELHLRTDLPALEDSERDRVLGAICDLLRRWG